MDARDDRFRRELQAAFSGKILRDEPMERHTSMRVGGRADVLAIPEDLGSLLTILGFLRASGVPFLPVGKGSNLIVRDGGYRGVLVSLQGLDGVEISSADEKTVIKAQAGVPLTEIITLTLSRSLAGMEFCAGIPGTVGGALRMNAGAFGREMKDVTVAMSVINGTGSVQRVPAGELHFSYRRLDMAESYIVVSGEFELSPGNRDEIAKRVREIIEWRGKRHPLFAPSAGSIFKNPLEEPAGRLIEQAGLKGRRVGNAAVSELHGNFIINTGKAAAKDVIDLIELVRKEVLDRTGIVLETEVKIIGVDE